MIPRITPILTVYWTSKVKKDWPRIYTKREKIRIIRAIRGQKREKG